MDKKELFNQRFYANAISDYKAGTIEIQNMINQGIYKKDVIYNKAQELSETIHQRLVKGYDELSSKIEKENSAIREKYQVKREYENPNEELLHRQDFDRKLNLMEDDDLLNFVNENLNENHITNYQLETIKIALKNGKFNLKQDDIELSLTTLEQKYYIGREWEKDKTYQDNLALEIQMQQIKPDMLWLEDNQKDWRPITVFDSMTENLRGYE